MVRWVPWREQGGSSIIKSTPHTLLMIELPEVQIWHSSNLSHRSWVEVLIIIIYISKPLNLWTIDQRVVWSNELDNCTLIGCNGSSYFHSYNIKVYDTRHSQHHPVHRSRSNLYINQWWDQATFVVIDLPILAEERESGFIALHVYTMRNMNDIHCCFQSCL